MPIESTLWGNIRDSFHVDDHVVRVENPIDPGTPDVSFCVDHIEGWMELKYQPIAKRRGVILGEKDGLNKHQKLWIEARARAGGRVLIVVGIADTVYFIGPKYARAVNTWKLAAYPLCSLTAARRCDPRSVRQAFLSAITNVIP